MDSASTVPTESTPTSFNLLNLTFPVLRNFLNIMPLEDLDKLRKNDTIKSLSRFRGEVVNWLYVEDTHVDNLGLTSYSRLVDRPYKTTPYAVLNVKMNPSINPDVLLSKLHEKSYSQLDLHGEYTWKNVVPFLYEGLETVELFGTMDLPQTDMKEFFKILANFKIKEFVFYPKNRIENWPEAAWNAWRSIVGTDLEPWEFHDLYGASLKIPIGNRVMEIHFDDRDVGDMNMYFDDESDDDIGMDDDMETDDDEEMDDDDIRMD